MDAYQRQAIGTWVHVCVLGDVSVRNPGGHDAKRKQFPRNTDDGEYIGMRIPLALVDHAMVCLVRSELTSTPVEQKDCHTRPTSLTVVSLRSRITLMHTGSPRYVPFQVSANPLGV